MEKAKAIAICLFSCLVMLQIFDVITTEMLLYQKGDFIELNILMRKVMDEGGMKDLIYAKIIIGSLIGSVIVYMWRTEHLKKHVPLALAIGIAMSTVTVVNNLWWCMTW